MTLVWPSEHLPAAPQLSGFVVRPDTGVVRTQMESGFARQRRRFSSRLTRVSLRWVMTFDQMAYFKAWIADEAGYGTEFFEITLRLGDTSAQDVMARFTGEPKYQPFGAFMWQVSADVEIKDPPLMSEDVIDVILTYGYAETLAAAAAIAPVTLEPFFAAWAGDFDV